MNPVLRACSQRHQRDRRPATVAPDEGWTAPAPGCARKRGDNAQQNDRPLRPNKAGAPNAAMTSLFLDEMVFTNTSGRPLVCARNSLVERLTPDGWITSTFNNFSKPDPLTVRPGQVGRFDLRVAPKTTRVRITTQISPMGWHWLLLSRVPEEWIPHSIGKILKRSANLRPRTLRMATLRFPHDRQNHY